MKIKLTIFLFFMFIALNLSLLVRFSRAEETTNGPISKAGEIIKITGKPGSPEQIVQLVKKLGLMVPLSTDLGGEAGCPKEAYSCLANLKHGLLALALDTLKSPEGEKTGTVGYGDLLKENLEKAGLDADLKNLKKDEVIPFGTIRRLAFGQPKEFPDLLVFHTAFTMICGFDECIYLFQKTSEGWKLVLAHEASGDKNATQENLAYLILEPKGKPTLVVIHTPLMCQSCWPALSLLALQPVIDPFKPKVLWADERPADRCTEDIELEKTDKGFSLKYTGQGEDPGFFKKVIEEYDLTSDTVKKIKVTKTDK